STSKTPSYTKSVSWHHYPRNSLILLIMILFTISHSVFGKENPVEILVNSREMALELSYVYIKYVYGKEKAEFQKPYSITDDNNCWKIEGKQPKTLGGNFTILIAKKDGQVLHVIHTK
ncbi:NTF2 fold immunity protein, partial [Escherichia coli]